MMAAAVKVRASRKRPPQHDAYIGTANACARSTCRELAMQRQTTVPSQACEKETRDIQLCQFRVRDGMRSGASVSLAQPFGLGVVGSGRGSNLPPCTAACRRAHVSGCPQLLGPRAPPKWACRGLGGALRKLSTWWDGPRPDRTPASLRFARTRAPVARISTAVPFSGADLGAEVGLRGPETRIAVAIRATCSPRRTLPPDAHAATTIPLIARPQVGEGQGDGRTAQALQRFVMSRTGARVGRGPGRHPRRAAERATVPPTHRGRFMLRENE